jgi:tetratricopeptide (TPR) repeat protein
MSFNVKDLAYHIKTMKEEGHSTALLIGAGVSVTSGIPLAGMMVQELTSKYPGYNLNEHLGKPNAYNEVMKALTPHQRETFLREKIKNAKINLAHFFIGSLVNNGYLDCILTTNFDPLLVKTLALLNIYPAIYDLANTKKFLPNAISFPCIFYLHGQGTAFRMLNTIDETKESTQYFSRLFEHLDKKHTWIIVGYSGETDYIFEGLKAQDSFSNNLFWIGREKEPKSHVKTGLCDKDSVRYIHSPGSDSFFRELNNELGLPLPSFVEKPFSHLKQMLQNIGNLQYEQDTLSVNALFLDQTYLKIENAISTIESTDKKPLTEKEIRKIEVGELEQKISELVTLGKYDEVIERADDILTLKQTETISDLKWAYILKADKLVEEGKLDLAENLYNKAFELDPDFAIVNYNWGTSLGELAKVRKDETLFKMAFEKLDNSAKMDPLKANVWYNWGTFLGDFASLKDNDEALLRESFEKFSKTIELEPGHTEALDNWGNYLGRLAQKLNHDEGLYQQCYEKYEQAVSYDPGDKNLWYNWGTYLGSHAESKDNDEELYQQAFGKYEKAINVNPSDFMCLSNWGTFLGRLAVKSEDIGLLHNAFEKFQRSTEVNPSFAKAWFNWAYYLTDLATLTDKPEFYEEADQKYHEAVQLSPSNHKYLYYWGNCLLRLGVLKENNKDLINRAIDKLNMSNTFRPNNASYDLCRAYSCLNETDKALVYFEESLKYKVTPSMRSSIEQDPPLKFISGLPQFTELLNKYMPVS